MQNPISIVSISSVSPLGDSHEEIWQNYLNNRTHIAAEFVNDVEVYISALQVDIRKKLEVLKQAKKAYQSLDDSVLFALCASRTAVNQANWKSSDNFGVNIGSSRGAAQLYETNHELFIKQKRVSAISSPTTTLGNISSWVAQDLQTKGPEISHSITCSTALHALLNGVAWINSGMSEKFLVGGSEAPLTPFTIAQMQALKIYAKIQQENEYPCRSLEESKSQNSMVLGEGAAMACLEKGAKSNALAIISGVGYATEIITHNVSISSNGNCFEQAMNMALSGCEKGSVDVIVTHTPGTLKGDAAEIKAIQNVFSDQLPVLTTNKWKIGHTLGASGMLSVEMAVLMLQNQKVISVPYIGKQKQLTSINKVLINAVGFGGNAVSILLTKK